MATLLDIITHKGVHYTDLIDERVKGEIRHLAIKLWPLQGEINFWRSGKIDIKADGNIVATSFSIELTNKIIIQSFAPNEYLDKNTSSDVFTT